MTIFLDRSNVNGADDYKRSGVTHLYLKVSEGTGFVDSTYLQRRQQAKAAGAHTGGYHFAGHNDPVAEANFFLSKLVPPEAGDLKPCLDLESGQSAAWAAAFLKHVHDKVGFWPVLYGSTSFIQPMRGNATIRKCPWWRAEFNVNDGQRHPLVGGDLGAAAHQYTSTAHIPGISGVTDQSAMIDEAKMLVSGAVAQKPYAIFKDGEHVKDVRRRSGVHLWMMRHRQPRRGHQIQIRHRES